MKKEFFIKLFSNLKEWFISSNRWIQLIAGCVIYLIMILIYRGSWPAILGAYAATLIVMLAGEYKDKAYKGKWDWKDINAGMLCGNIALIVYLVITII